MNTTEKLKRLQIAKQFLDQAVKNLEKNRAADVDFDVWRACKELKLVDDAAKVD